MRCECEIAVGAYVLDALEPDEQLRMQGHVQGCPVCTQTVRELEALPRLLSSVPTPGEAPVAPAPSELAFERFRRSAAAQTVPPRRGVPRRVVAAAAAALVAAAALIVTLVVVNRGPDPTVVEASAGTLHVRAAYVPANDGTSVDLTLEGLPFGQRCELVAVADDGSEEAADPWRVTYRGTYHWSGWVGIEPTDIEQFVIRTMDGEPLVTVPT